MESNIETFEKELNSIAGICSKKIKCCRALLKEYEAIRSSALSLLKLNNNTKVKVVSLIDALKRRLSIDFTRYSRFWYNLPEKPLS